MQYIYLVNYYFNNMDFKKEFEKYVEHRYNVIRPMKNTYLVKTGVEPTPKDLYCSIAPYITGSDKLLITEMTNAYGWLDPKAWDWVQGKITKEQFENVKD